MIGFCKHRSQMITTCVIKSISILEIPMLVIHIYSAAYISSYGLMVGAIIALCLLVLTNVTFFIVYNITVVKDNAFKHWRDKYNKSVSTVAVISLILNFKFFR
jgi:hypothetical protein